MLELPDDLTDPIQLADWLELYALISPDRNSSRGDIDTVLRREMGDGQTDEEIESKIADTFFEIEQRSKAAGNSYPFQFDYKGVLELRANWREIPTYLFCLIVSYVRLPETHDAPRLFETLARNAAENYLKGQAVEFGFPRSNLPPSFSGALVDLSKRIGEGGLRGLAPIPNVKDDTLDLVAWKPFLDGRPSQLIIFGQCATGRNWQSKLGELNPETFCRQWIPKLVSPYPQKSFFTPYRVKDDKWEFFALKCGILFDRCRIAYWSHQSDNDFGQHLTWIDEQINSLT